MKRWVGEVILVSAGLAVMLSGAAALAGPATPEPSGAACSQVIRVLDPWARPAHSMAGMHGMGSTTAAYMTLRNDGSESDALIAVRTDVAARPEIHETRIENNVARMVPIPRLEVPAGGQVQLRPGGLHIMLMDLRRALRVGDRFRVVLVFERCGELPVEVVVRQP